MNSFFIFITFLGKCKVELTFFTKILGFICIEVSAYGQLNPSGCGKRPFYNTNKIVGGSVAVPGDWGWQVNLYCQIFVSLFIFAMLRSQC
jgi:hypothetical protein